MQYSKHLQAKQKEGHPVIQRPQMESIDCYYMHSQESQRDPLEEHMKIVQSKTKFERVKMDLQYFVDFHSLQRDTADKERMIDW